MPPRSLAVLVAALLAAPPLAPAPQATASPDLERGIRQAQEGEFERAVITLDGVVRDLKGREGSSGKDLSRAYVYLAVSYLGLGQEPAARGSFLEALKIDPDLELSSKEYPPRIVKLFEETRRSATVSLPPPPRTLAPPPEQPAATTPPAEKKGGSKTPLILLGVGGAAAAGVAVAASGGGGSSSPSTSPTPNPLGPVASSIILTELSPPSGSSLIIPLDPPYYGSQIPRSSGILRVGLSITVAGAVSQGGLGVQLLGGSGVCAFNLPDYPSWALQAGQTINYTVTGFDLWCPIPFDVTGIHAMLIQGGKTITSDPPPGDILVEATFPVSYSVRH
jgi:hypothetical protein